MSELQRLSDAATPGPLRFTDIGAAPAQILSNGGMVLATFYGLSSDEEALALAQLAVELVNGWREGRLVEAPRCTQEIHPRNETCPDDVPPDYCGCECHA